MPISNGSPKPGVAGRPRPAAHALRRLAVLLGLAGALSATPAGAGEPPAASPAEPSQPPASEAAAGYALPLGLAYLGAPFLALALGGGMSKLTTDDTVSVLVGGLPFALPAAVHLAHGETKRGLLALPALVGVTFLGVAVGGYSGLLFHPLTCGRDAGTETCDDTLPVSIIAGAVVGGVLGYGTYAAIDISMNSTPSRHFRKRDVAGLQLWIQPLQVQAAFTAVGFARSPAPVAERRLAGALVGACFEL